MRLSSVLAAARARHGGLLPRQVVASLLEQPSPSRFLLLLRIPEHVVRLPELGAALRGQFSSFVA